MCGMLVLSRRAPSIISKKTDILLKMVHQPSKEARHLDPLAEITWEGSCDGGWERLSEESFNLEKESTAQTTVAHPVAVRLAWLA